MSFEFQKLQQSKSGNENDEKRNAEDPKNEPQSSKTSSSPEKPNKKNVQKPNQPPLQPPKIHFEDGNGVVGKVDAQEEQDNQEDADADENKDEKGSCTKMKIPILIISLCWTYNQKNSFITHSLNCR